MSRMLVTGNAAAAWGARLARADYVPAFPITPQTEIIETLGGWIEAGELDARMVTLDSEHSMLTAAGAAAATGVRVFTATSSQGLLYAMEMIYTVAGWRAPFVLANVSRALAAPITLEPDHNDVLAARDSGFLQLHAATCQEVLDLTLLAYRLSEDEGVRLPIIVNLDGFYLSFTREPVQIPEPSAVDAFLPAFDPGGLGFSASRPVSQAVAVLGGGPYSYFRYEMHEAARNALAVFDQVAADFGDRFGRHYSPVESYRCDDAEIAFVMMGSFATKAKDAVDQLRDAGQAVGLVRPRMLRPFPDQALRDALVGRRGVAVIDQNLSMGLGGVLHTELSAALCGVPNAPVLASFVGGLGGRDIGASEFFAMVDVAREAARSGMPPVPRLLYTRSELREMRKLQGIAAAERAAAGQPGDGA
ncbi:MAG: pyruvate synthase [Deltaproteobacteria bacterium]|nr:pyruvate synthase [Deltaproteobacteria bacterium]